VAAAPPSSVMKSRRFTPLYLPCFRTKGIAHRELLRCGISIRPMSGRGLGCLAAEKLPRTYIRCLQWPNAVYDRHAEAARQTPGWRSRELATSHLPYITHPREVADLLHEVAA
jgi:hypothetical protein